MENTVSDNVFLGVGILTWLTLTPLTFFQMKKYMDLDKHQKYFLANISFFTINMLVTIFMFGAVYGKYGILDSSNNPVYGFSTGIYFSIVTWTTLGYGDFHPSEKLRYVASFEALMGYMYLGVLVGIVMNKLLHRKES